MELISPSCRSIVIDTHAYDWEGDTPLNIPLDETVVYKLPGAGSLSRPLRALRTRALSPA
jgi:isoamylase